MDSYTTICARICHIMSFRIKLHQKSENKRKQTRQLFPKFVPTREESIPFFIPIFRKLRPVLDLLQVYFLISFSKGPPFRGNKGEKQSPVSCTALRAVRQKFSRGGVTVSICRLNKVKEKTSF